MRMTARTTVMRAVVSVPAQLLRMTTVELTSIGTAKSI